MEEIEEDDGGGGGGGAPLWMATFSDMMSLLLAFFVLLFSFASMDDAVYNEIGGSMKEAFGVQRRELLTDPVLGVNYIATEFSSARPDPETLNVVPEDDLAYDSEKATSQTESPDASVSKSNQATEGNSSFEAEIQSNQSPSSISNIRSKTKENSTQAAAGISKRKSETSAQEEAASQAERKANNQQTEDSGAKFSQTATANTESKADNPAQSKADGEKLGKADEPREFEKKGQTEGEKRGLTETVDPTVKNETKSGVAQFAAKKAKELGKELAQEIANGKLQVETAGNKVIIRVSEETAFPPGGAESYSEFQPAIDKISKVVKDSPGRVIVEGHTDNIPIQSTKYRSNFELSASRAATVVHGLINSTGLPTDRFEVRGLGDSRPIASNRTAKGRAKNRRVEVILEYDSKDLVPEELQKDLPEEEDDAPQQDSKEKAAPPDPNSKLYKEFDKSLKGSNLEKSNEPSNDTSDEYRLIFRDDFFR